LAQKEAHLEKEKTSKLAHRLLPGKPAICFSFVVDEVADNAGKPFT
jgi:hypothetical protein